MKNFIFTIGVLISSMLYAQSDINQLVQTITQNNTALKAQLQSQEVQSAGFNMGRELQNPEVGLDYFIGSFYTKIQAHLELLLYLDQKS